MISNKSASNKRVEYKRSQTVASLPLGRNKPTTSAETFASESSSRRCSSGPSMAHQISSSIHPFPSRSNDVRRSSQHRKSSSTSSSASTAFHESTSTSRKSSEGSIGGHRVHPPLLTSTSYGPRKTSQQSVVGVVVAASTKKLGRVPSSPSVLFSKVKEKIKEKVFEASSEWPQMAIIIQERRQRAAVEFEIRLQEQQRHFLQQLPPHQQLLYQQQQLQQQLRRESLRTISSDQIVHGNRRQQQFSKKRHRAKSDSGQRTHSYDRDSFHPPFLPSYPLMYSSIHQPTHHHYHHQRDSTFHINNMDTSTRRSSCNRSNSNNSTSSSTSVNYYHHQPPTPHLPANHKSFFAFKSSSKKKGHLLSRLGGSVDVQTARSNFRRRSISDDVTNQPAGHMMNKMAERKNSRCGTGIICSDDDLRAIFFEHKQRKSPGQHQMQSSTPSSAFMMSTTKRILLKQAPVERYSPEICSIPVGESKESSPLYHLGKPSPSDKESESGNSTSRASPVKPRTAGGDNDDICVTVNMTESENETLQGIPVKDNNVHLFNTQTERNETEKFPSAAKKSKLETEIETSASPRESATGVIPEVTFDSKGQTWDVYGAEFDPEILGQAIQLHLEKIIEKNLQNESAYNPSTSGAEHDDVMRSERRMRSERMNEGGVGGGEYLKLSLLGHSGGCEDTNNGRELSDNNYFDVTSNNNLIYQPASPEASDNGSMDDDNSMDDNTSYRRRFTHLITRYLCSLVPRRGHAQSVL